MYCKFLEHGYPTWVFDRAQEKALTDRSGTSHPRDRPLFAHTFKRESDGIKRVVKLNFNIL